MFKRALITSALLGTIALTNSGCGDGVVGPERRSQAQPDRQPVPIEFQAVRAAGLEVSSVPPKCLLAGDLTGDGRVDASDVSAYASLLRIDLYADQTVDTTDEQLLYAVIRNEPIDVNGNGRVDASDYSAFAAAKARADFNHSGRVDASDISYFAWAKRQLDLTHDGLVNPEDRAELERQLGQVSACA